MLLHWSADGPLPMRMQGATTYDSGGRSYVKYTAPPPHSPSGISRMCSVGGHGNTDRQYGTLSEGSGDQPYSQSALEAAHVPRRQRDAESE